MEQPLEFKEGALKVNLYKNPNNYPFNCVCGKNFSTEKNFRAHKKKIHNETTNLGSLTTQKKCPLCTYKSNSRPELIKHFESRHDLPSVQKKIEFESKDLFLKWKNEVESQTLSRFVLQRGSTKFKTHVTSMYTCHRSGYYTSVGKGIRHLNIQGTAKINGFCPAAITLKTYNDGRCHVLYTSTHVGHINEFKHLTLSSVDRENIARKMSLKVPFDDILDEIRDSIYDSDVQRIHMLTRQDLYNIEASFNLTSKAVRHKNDALSVDSWVKQMQEQETDQNCILFYKPQGIVLEELPNFKIDDFILMIMTSAQLDILEQYGSDCICLDGTHGLNNYDFELNTLLVLDDLREGFPCGFLISNRSDTQVLQLFFSKVKDRAGIIKTNIFMSDLADTFFNAWILEMGMPEKRLYCTWHVDRSWRKNLSKIKGKEAQIEMYKHLRTLLMERDVNAFHKMLTEFCNIDNPDYSEFLKYFKEHYATKFKYWAYCYRLYAGVNTNMHLERMHRSLKYMYLRGKNVKRLDKGICAIMTFVRDKLINKLIVINKGKLSSKIVNIRSRHKNMEKMNADRVIKTDQGWEVLAESGFEIYSIQKKEITCNNCQLICSDCKICIHQYQCSCLDSAIKYNLCKHIHLVAKVSRDTAQDTGRSQMLCIEETDNIDALVVDEETYKKNCQTIVNELSHKNPEQDFLRRKKELIERYLESLKSIDLPDQLDYMERHFLPINSTLAAIKDANKCKITPLKAKTNVASNKNIVPQKRFFSTKKKSQKLTKKSFSSPELNNNAVQLSGTVSID